MDMTKFASTQEKFAAFGLSVAQAIFKICDLSEEERNICETFDSYARVLHERLVDSGSIENIDVEALADIRVEMSKIFEEHHTELVGVIGDALTLYEMMKGFKG